MRYSLVMRETNIASLDLNLLVTLKVLLDEKHVTRAADKLALSQPAMSRALGRLRVMFKDPLLVKSKDGLAVTARAQELYVPLQRILKDVEQLMTNPTFDPASSQAEISIATRDYEMAAILPEAIKRITKNAPGISLKIVPFLGDDLEILEKNDVDFVVAGTNRDSSTLSRETLLTDSFVCVAAAEQKELKKNFDLNKYLSMRHCLITFNDDRPGLIDSMLMQMGVERKAIVRIPQFLAASYLLKESDLILTIPRRLAKLFCQTHGFIQTELPLKIADFPIYLYWHIRNQNNPMHLWVRKQISSSIKGRASKT